MDEHRFDHLTRSFARGNSRRGVLKGLAGLIGGALGLRVAPSAEARTRAVNGAACSSPRDCASGLCVDGVCCDAHCIGTCESCTVDGLAGICSPVTGAPVGNRGPCPGDAVCGGSCDGVTTASCAGYPADETVCGEATCRGGYQISQVCSGNGLCIELATYCGLYICADNGSGCLTACAADGDCVGEAYCVDGMCQGDLPLGTGCDRPDQCLSGQCVDGVCCDTACDGDCRACGADGFCGNGPNDETCDGGACCDGDCIGEEACCTADVCPPPSGANPCEGDPICVNHACDFAPIDEGTPCSEASCAGGIETRAAACTGVDTICPPGEQRTCDPYLCGETACTTACSDNTGCADAAYCADEQCLPDEEQGQPCDEDGDCLSGHCAGGVCCAASRACGEVCCAGHEECTEGVCTCLAANQCHGACCPNGTTCVSEAAGGETIGVCCSDALVCRDANEIATACCGTGESCLADGVCCADGDIQENGSCCSDAKICGPACCGETETCFYGSTEADPDPHYFCGILERQLCYPEACPIGYSCIRYPFGDIFAYGCCPDGSACGEDEAGYATACCGEADFCQENGTCGACDPACGEQERCLGDGSCCAEADVCGAGCCPEPGLCGDDGSCCAEGCGEGEACLNGACCSNDGLCADTCCDSSDTCLLLSTELTGDGGWIDHTVCCPAGQACRTSLGFAMCCDDGQTCLGPDACCPDENVCGDECCGAGEFCALTQGNGVDLYYCAPDESCPDGSRNTRDGCCPYDRACDAECCAEGDTCRQMPTPGDSFCCPAGSSDCGDMCCPDDKSCYHPGDSNEFCCVADLAFANDDVCCRHDRYAELDLGFMSIRVCCDDDSIPYNKGISGLNLACCPAEWLLLNCGTYTGCKYTCVFPADPLAYEKEWF